MNSFPFLVITHYESLKPPDPTSNGNKSFEKEVGIIFNNPLSVRILLCDKDPVQINILTVLVFSKDTFVMKHPY